MLLAIVLFSTIVGEMLPVTNNTPLIGHFYFLHYHATGPGLTLSPIPNHSGYLGSHKEKGLTYQGYSTALEYADKQFFYS